MTYKDVRQYISQDKDFILLQGDCFELLPQIDSEFDMIFADPPYFLSNGGITCKNGKIACVDKGDWDKGGTPESIMEFNRRWQQLCQSPFLSICQTNMADFVTLAVERHC